MRYQDHPVVPRKLTAELARAIRIAAAAGASPADLAEEYGVSVITIGEVLRYETWRHAGP